MFFLIHFYDNDLHFSVGLCRYILGDLGMGTTPNEGSVTALDDTESGMVT